MEGERDTRMMREALRLARRAEGRTSPNPQVGAVVSKNGRIVGRGYHRGAGCPHAEVAALTQAQAAARGATLYTTLEPCNHYGRTPPCCDAILRAGVSRVVMAAHDPNPIVNGRGVARLRRAGIRVTTGVLEEQARRLNAPFLKVMTAKLPLVIAKVAMSLDGKIATAGRVSRWITSPAARHLSHRWRARVDAVLVGIATVLADDPLLTARGTGRRSARPFKVIVDSRLRMPVSARCLSRRSPAPTLIATTARSATRRAALERAGADVLVLPPERGRVPLRKLLRILAHRGIHSVMVEGGGEVLASAFEGRLVDRVVWFVAPIVIGGRAAPTAVGGRGVAHLARAPRLADVRVIRAGPDVCVEGRVVYP